MTPCSLAENKNSSTGGGFSLFVMADDLSYLFLLNFVVRLSHLCTWIFVVVFSWNDWSLSNTSRSDSRIDFLFALSGQILCNNFTVESRESLIFSSITSDFIQVEIFIIKIKKIRKN